MKFNDAVLLWGILSIIIGYIMNYLLTFPSPNVGKTSLTNSGLFLLVTFSCLFSGVLIASIIYLFGD